MDFVHVLAEELTYPIPYPPSFLVSLVLFLSAIKHSPNTKAKFSDEYDYIVVGAGSAGSAVAGRLSEESCVSVLLLEAGKPPPISTELPAITRYFINTDIDWQYFTTPQRHTAAGHVDRKIPWPSGKTLGGSSVLNGMLYVRGNRRNYDEWAELGATGWSYEDVLPYFKKLEDNRDLEYRASGYHDTRGPILASRPSHNSVKKLATVKAVQDEGFEFVDPNAAEQNGFYDYQSSMGYGQRWSTAKGYLVPAENRSNLDIVPKALVRKVLIEDKKVKGVELDFEGSTRRVRARREVILSAGTTNTAQLLMLSGIGPMSELEKFNIPVLADLPVGLNFQDHPATILIFEVNGEITPQFDYEIKAVESVIRYIRTRRGPLTSSGGLILMSFLNNSGNGMEGIPDHSLYLGDFTGVQVAQAGFTPEVVKKLLLPNVERSLINCAVQLLRPRSVGSVTLQSADPYDPPVIDPNYYEDDRDINDVVQGMKNCMRIMNSPVMKKLGAKPIDALVPGCEEFAGDMDLYFRCIVRTIVVTTSHQVGTAKMGDPEDPTTVVDPELRVKGIQGLRVVDASVMPKIPWGNTNIPTIMIAEKASDIIKSTIQCSGK